MVSLIFKIVTPVIFFTSLFVLCVVLCFSCDFVGDLFLPSLPKYQFEKNWKLKEVPDSKALDKIFINVPKEILGKLNKHLDESVVPNSLDGANFKFGFNSAQLRELLKHWRHSYKWHDWERKVNAIPQYFFTLRGLRLQVAYVNTTEPAHGVRIVPILLLHGWPGSFFEFYKLLPLLSQQANQDGLVFEIVCPSLPGFGWSEAPEKAGMGLTAMAELFLELMDRLNINRPFYVQGGDWGSLIASHMAKLRPDRIAGIHLNMIMPPFFDFRYWVKLGLGAVLPAKMHFLSEDEQNMIYPYCEHLKKTIDTMGYFILQSTRPDTLGTALTNSPAGLAAYIGEKFLAWSVNSSQHRDSADGGLSQSGLHIDEILTNIMIYHITGTITSTMRIYREQFIADNTIDKLPVRVPVGLAVFPDELVRVPRELARLAYRDIRQYTVMPRGGHFAALQEPELLASDIRQFVLSLEPPLDQEL